jgi:hypothetical protein
MIPCERMSSVNDRLTAECSDWSTGRMGLPSAEFGAWFRKIELGVARDMRAPFTSRFTTTW